MEDWESFFEQMLERLEFIKIKIWTKLDIFFTVNMPAAEETVSKYKVKIDGHGKYLL